MAGISGKVPPRPRVRAGPGEGKPAPPRSVTNTTYKLKPTWTTGTTAWIGFLLEILEMVTPPSLVLMLISFLI